MPWDANISNAGFSTGTPWLPVPGEHAAASVRQQWRDPASVLNFSSKLIAWRKTVPQLTRGDIAFYDAPEPVLALRRDLAGLPSVIAIVNLGEQPVSFDLPDSAAYEAMQGHGFVGAKANGRVELPGYGAWFGMEKI
jgi:alpha-glucosidase